MHTRAIITALFASERGENQDILNDSGTLVLGVDFIGHKNRNLFPNIRGNLLLLICPCLPFFMQSVS